MQREIQKKQKKNVFLRKEWNKARYMRTYERDENLLGLRTFW